MKDLKITKGECQIGNSPMYGKGQAILDDIGCLIIAQFADYKTEGKANVELYKDAHNTANKCNRLPSQLLEERNKLLEALIHLNQAAYDGKHLEKHRATAGKLIQSIEKATK